MYVSRETLKEQSSPIVRGDHPEVYDTEFLLEEDKAKYMSMISTAQWLSTLGRIDIAIAMSTLSLYRAAPQKGHVKHMKTLYRYAKHFPMLLYILVETSLTTVKWYMNPMKGYTLLTKILKKNSP